MPERIARSFCRICNGGCGVLLTIDEDDRIVDIRGDKDQPISKGYACFKGLQAEEAHHGAARLLQPRKRRADGSFGVISLDQALSEIGTRLKALRDDHGADSIALFTGGGADFNAPARTMHASFMSALGSPHHYSTLTIDQSAKAVAFERLGGWAAGTQGVDQSQVVLLFGANPLVTHATAGFLTVNPTRELKRVKAAGLKLICVDPRRSETARHADLFVQPIPGQDAAVAAGLIRLILDEGWGDQDFCEKHVGAERMARLREVVEPFTPHMVEQRARIGAGQIRAVAEMFARDHRKGAAFTATGPNMAPFSNLAQHMVTCLNVVCGRFRREGDQVPVDICAQRHAVYAEVIAPPRSWDSIPRSRIRGVGRIFGEKLTGTLAEEILSPGPGQIRALLVDGGNIAVNVPDQSRMVEALRSLPLLVTIDPFMTPTAQLSDYVLPPFMQYERPDMPMSLGGYEIYPSNWYQYTPALLAPPKGSELIHDWYFFWNMGKQLGLSIVYDGKVELDMQQPPDTHDLLRIRLMGSSTSLEELQAHPSGHRFENVMDRVLPAREGQASLFDVMPLDVAQECANFLAAKRHSDHFESQGRRFSHLLSARRLRDAMNSNGTRLDGVLARIPFNPAYLHPDELAALGLRVGDRVEIESDHGVVEATVMADDTLRRDIVTLAHGWGGLPGTEGGSAACVNRLIDCSRDFDEVNAMPRMSAIPVNLRRLTARAADEVVIEENSRTIS
jgi:anaerobic selenocysteine-containing dehydrogenase